jgi:N-methylhydantoinase A/oxoprolinase/acetone carboxylase beta subunit
MNLEYVERYPVNTFASGPANSMRGAAFLSGTNDCAVVDIGGTTSDIGILQGGFPREASKAIVSIGGVRTNFRMPDVLSLPIGGGSLIDESGEYLVGPASVGYRLTEQAMVFGGDTFTATDAAVAMGRASIGRAEHAGRVDKAVAQRALDSIATRIADTIDRMKVSAAEIPAVVVGGGGILLPDSLPGLTQLMRPDHFAVANAIGATIAQVSGTVDHLFSIDSSLTRERAVARATEMAVQRAIDAGAAPDTVEIVDVEERALAYVPGNALRIRAKAVGSLLDETDG